MANETGLTGDISGALTKAAVYTGATVGFLVAWPVWKIKQQLTYPDSDLTYWEAVGIAADDLGGYSQKSVGGVDISMQNYEPSYLTAKNIFLAAAVVAVTIYIYKKKRG